MPSKKSPKKLFERHAGGPVTTYAAFDVSEKVIEQIEECAPVYGSLGRALQVATEVLVRQKRPVRPSSRGSGETTRKTYKLLPRTIAQIEQLTPIYGDKGSVLAACAAVLKENS